MLLCTAGGRSASPKNEVAGIAGYISNVSFQIVRLLFDLSMTSCLML